MPWPQILGGIASGLLGAGAAQQGISDIKDMAAFNPWSGSIGGLGQFGMNDGQFSFQQDPNLGAAQTGMMAGMGQALGGGMSGMLMNPWATGDMTGAVSQMSNALSQQANPFYNQGMFNQNLGNISSLGNMFAQQVGMGPQDMTGGAMGNMFGQGQANMAQAGNLGGLVSQYNQQLDQLAAPGEQRAFNRFMDNEFQLTGGATSGAGQRGGEFAQAQAQAANQRGLMAQQFGQTEAARLGQLGLGQMGQAAGLMGQNLGFFGDQAQRAQGFAGLGLQGEGQGWQQMLGALNQNQSAGTQRINNMMSIFGGMGDQYLGALGLAPQMTRGLTDIGSLGLQGVLGLLNAEAGRVQGTGYHSQAMSGLKSSQGGFLAGLF
jgi:hypothetical protein